MGLKGKEKKEIGLKLGGFDKQYWLYLKEERFSLNTPIKMKFSFETVQS